eukprot:9066502-Pyramimonas_sp.AAC.1
MYNARAMSGAGNWLAIETRPGITVQVTMGQQILPQPAAGRIRHANTLVRRAKQFSAMRWRVRRIPLSRLRPVAHTGASNKRSANFGTQAGYRLVATDDATIGGHLA